MVNNFNNENLDDLEKQLEASLAEVKRKKELQKLEQQRLEKERLEKEKNRCHIIIQSIDHENKIITLKNSYRLDVVTLLQHTPNRKNLSFGISSIPFDSWKDFLSKLHSLDNVLISYAEPRLATEIDNLNREPDWKITKLSRELKLVAGKNGKAYHIMYGSIPGVEYRPHMQAYTVPLAEAWRFVDYFENKFPDLIIEYDDESLEFIKSVYEKLSLIHI